jgi:hypothetical protein
MAKQIDEAREDRIHMEIIVDANGPEELVMGWYYYLEEELAFPFTAKCTTKRSTSPLKKNVSVEVTGMAPLDDCQSEMFVTIRWQDDELSVPLAQLTPADSSDEPTRQAVEDWLYWVQRGYQV